jgi:hypothetical protein
VVAEILGYGGQVICKPWVPRNGNTVYGLCAEGTLPHVRILNAIRIAPPDLQAFVDNRRTVGRLRASSRRPLSSVEEGDSDEPGRGP